MTLVKNPADSSPNVDERLVGFPELFEAQVVRTPERPAIFFEDQELDYRGLNRRANQIAWMLIDGGVEREQRIGICLDRSIDAIATMFGILKAGGAFVPLDPEYPADRLQFIVEDAGIDCILCEPKYAALFHTSTADEELEIIHLDSVDLNPFQSENTGRQVSACDLAYIMYTSGSTGKPKGVQIEHGALAAYCYADIDVYELTPDDRTLQFSTLSFDIAIEEIYPPLIMGGSVVVRPRERAAAQNELSEIVNRHGVTAIHLATAYWHEWVDLMVANNERVPSSIRLMVVTGEKVSAQHYQRWLGLCDQSTLWCNAYGPTEATVSATVFIPPEGWDEDNLPIGKPLKRYTGYILDEERRLVGAGETGELYIGGPALARGYLNRDDLTEKAFVNVILDGCEQRLYRSGDLCRWLDTGDIEFGGRIDHQIKLGSYRIEPGEIEAALNQYPMVLESLVTYEEIAGKKYLIAYVAQGNRQISLSDLADALRERLPVYMVPSRFVLMDSFPKTINGKIDRKRLPSPETSQVARSKQVLAPRNGLERDLVAIWKEVLNVPSISISDDFFALGGSSLLVTRVITQVKQSLDLEIPVRDFFANPTIASIARHLMEMSGGTVEEASDELVRKLRESLPAPQPCFFAGASRQCFAVKYAPTSEPRKHGVLICPSQGHEYVRAHRNLQQLAVQLAQDGFEVMRFDYSGTGNSQGDCEDVRLEEWQGDIVAAKEHLLKTGTFDKVSIIGIRLGATLATTAALSDVEAMILWDPVLSGGEYLEMLESFHHTALTELWRYPVVRNGLHGQLFGFSMREGFRTSLSQLELLPTRCAERVHVVCSQGQPATALTNSQKWSLHQTPDEIFWELGQHAGDAFSSPATFQTIRRLLAGDDL